MVCQPIEVPRRLGCSTEQTGTNLLKALKWLHSAEARGWRKSQVIRIRKIGIGSRAGESVAWAAKNVQKRDEEFIQKHLGQLNELKQDDEGDWGIGEVEYCEGRSDKGRAAKVIRKRNAQSKDAAANGISLSTWWSKSNSWSWP